MANYVKFKQGLKKDFNTTNQPLTNGMIYFVIDENNHGSIYYDTIVDGKKATKNGTVHRVKFSGLPIKITGSVIGTGVISQDGEIIEINTSTNHSHGLAHQDFTVTLSDDDTNLKWTRLGNQNGGGFWLKSIRGQAKAPAWFQPDYSAGIAFGGADTKGVISVRYYQPSVRFAGGNGSAPVWYFTITGSNDKTYDLNGIGGHSSDSAKLDHNVTFKIASTADATKGGSGTATDLSGSAVDLYLPTRISGFDLLQATRFQGNADTSTVAAKLGRGGNTSLPMTFNWSGQGGQPTWLWGGENGTDMYVYNPSNFSVAHSVNTAGLDHNITFKISKVADATIGETGITTNLTENAITFTIPSDLSGFNNIQSTRFQGTADNAHRLIDQGIITAINGTSRYASGLRIGGVYNSGYPFSYGVALTMESNNFGAELIFNGLGGGGDTGSGDMRFRTHSDWSTSEWGGWRTVLDTSNYTGTLDGRYVNITGDTMTGDLNVPRIHGQAEGHNLGYRHLDAGNPNSWSDSRLYIGYGAAFKTRSIGFYNTNDDNSIKTQWAEINDNGLYALTRFGVNGQNTSYNFYVNGTSYFNGNTTHNGIDYFANGTTYYINNNAYANLRAVGSSDNTYIAYPQGGGFRTSTQTQTGYLKITLPQSWTNTMISFKVQIYEYSTGYSCEYTIGGYNYNSPGTWQYSPFAYSVGKNDTLAHSNLPVRLGHDGTKCSIYIGESNTSWSYMQVQVHSIIVGFSNYEYSKWASGWSVGFTNTLGTITATITNPNSSYSASKLTTARTIWGQTFDGTQNITGNFSMSGGDQINMTGAAWDGFAFNYNANKKDSSGNVIGQSTRFYDGKTIEIVRFTAGGSVGIGTSSPAYKLHAIGDIYADGGWLRTSGAAGWYNETYGGGWYMTDSNFIRNFNSKAISININSNNSWGIGGHRLATVFKGNDHVSILLSTNTLGYGLCVNNDGNWYWGKRTTNSETSASGDTYLLQGNTTLIRPFTDMAIGLGQVKSSEFSSAYIRAVHARHLDASGVFSNDMNLYIGYGDSTPTQKTLFYYSTGTHGANATSRTQFAEINSNGLYALTRFGVNGQNTDYTCYINGTLFSGAHTVYGRADSNTAPSNFYYNGALEIRESNLVANSTSANSFNYAPRIGFHWRGRIAASLSFHNDGIFYFRKQDGSSRATIDANVNGTATNANSAGNADTTDGVHLEWSGEQAASATDWIAGWSADGKKIKAIRRSDLATKNSDVAAKLGQNGNVAIPMTFYWNGQGGQPNWIWGGNDGTNMYVYNPSNFSVSNAGYIRSMGNQAPESGRTAARGGVYTYNMYDQTANGAPGTYLSVIGFGNGIGGHIEIAGQWVGNSGLWMRGLRDCCDDWYSWNRIWCQGNSVTGAVWNDYAECRQSDCSEPGRVVFEKGDDTLTKTEKRLQHFAGVISDTWGFSQGETDKAKTNIAVAGRVLVYTYQDRNNYKPGDCVCAAPNGTIDIMTREEIIKFPDRIVGTVSCVPDYEEWGGGKNADRDPVKVNCRIWIKVK